MRSRRGITLVESLVVIVTATLVIILALPAIQVSREAARRSQCANNLKQIALAVANYESTNGSLPLGASLQPVEPGVTYNWACWGASAGILPFMEEPILFNSINFSLAPEPSPEPDGSGVSSTGGLANMTAYNSKMRSYICPADRNSGKMNTNNYHASVGTSTFNTGPSPINTSGVFGMQVVYKLADITDGTSNTIAYSEALTGDPNTDGPRQGNGVGDSGSSKAANQLDITGMAEAVMADLDACNSKYASVYAANDRGYRWGLGVMGYSLFNAIVPPNGGDDKYKWNSCRVDCCDYALAAHYAPATSRHPGGVNAAKVDGSVFFAKNSINLKTWWALGTRGNGEVIPSDSY